MRKRAITFLFIAACLLGHRAFAQVPAPTLLTPVDMALVSKNSTFQFYWGVVAGATEYQFMWSGDGANWQTVNTAGTALAWTLAENYPMDNPFRWRVRAKVAGVYTGYSVEWRVQNVPPGANVPTLTSPAHLANVGHSAFTYNWNTVSGATEYELAEKGSGGAWISRTVLPTDLPLSSSLVADYTAAAPFSWKVRAKVGGIYYGWSTVGRLYTEDAAAPALQAPADLSLVAKNTSIPCRWSAVAGATGYTLEWSDDNWATIHSVATQTTAATVILTYDYPADDPVKWRVKAKFGTASTSATSDEWRVYTVAVGAPTLSAPADLENVGHAAFSYNWSAVAGATGYEVESGGVVTPIADGATTSLLVSGGIAANIPITAPRSWRVRAVVGSQYGPWSAVRRLYTVTPAAPSLQMPVDWSYVTKNTSVTYRWAAVLGATGYTLEWSEDNWTTVHSVAAPTNSTTVTLTYDYPADDPVKWRVKASLPQGATTAYSAVWQVYTVAVTGAPILSAPADMYYVALSIGWTYSWSGVSGATGYELQTSTNGGASWTTTTVPSTSYNMTGGLSVNYPPGGPFLWRVRARIGPQYTAWSSTRRIYTEVPAVPALLTPATPAFIPQNQAWIFRWTAVPGATNYTVEVKKGNSGAWEAFATVTVNSASATGLGIAYTLGDPYRWRVWATVGTGQSAYSSEGIIYNTAPVTGLYNGLVLQYTFNGNTNDQSGNGGPDATAHGATVATGRLGTGNTAYAFDGGTGYVAMDRALNQPFKTIAFWAKSDAAITTSVPHHLMGEENTGTGIHMGPYTNAVDNEVVTLNFDGGALHWDDSTFPSGIDQSWKHYVFVWKESTPYGYKLFVDGVAKGGPDLTSGSAAGAGTYISNEQWNIGRFGDSASDGWLGMIDDLKIWNRALNDVEVASLYAAAKPLAGAEAQAAAGGPALVSSQNAPNPFNPSTVISYELGQAAHVTVTVYNTLGHRVAVLQDEWMPAGAHAVKWDAGDVASGIYLYRIQVGSFTETKKMLLFK